MFIFINNQIKKVLQKFLLNVEFLQGNEDNDCKTDEEKIDTSETHKDANEQDEHPVSQQSLKIVRLLPKVFRFSFNFSFHSIICDLFK